MKREKNNSTHRAQVSLVMMNNFWCLMSTLPRCGTPPANVAQVLFVSAFQSFVTMLWLKRLRYNNASVKVCYIAACLLTLFGLIFKNTTKVGFVKLVVLSRKQITVDMTWHCVRRTLVLSAKSEHVLGGAPVTDILGKPFNHSTAAALENWWEKRLRSRDQVTHQTVRHMAGNGFCFRNNLLSVFLYQASFRLTVANNHMLVVHNAFVPSIKSTVPEVWLSSRNLIYLL